MPLCKYCLSIDFQAIYDGKDHPHISNGHDLKELTSQCSLCSLVAKELMQAVSLDFDYHCSRLLPERIIIRRPLQNIEEGIDTRIASQPQGPISDLDVVLPFEDGEDSGRLSVYADPGQSSHV